MATASSPSTSLFGNTAVIRRLETQFDNFQVQQGAFATLVNDESIKAGFRMAAMETMIREIKEQGNSAFEAMAAQKAAEMSTLVADIRAEFESQRKQLQTTTGAVQVEFNRLQQQIDQGGTRDAGPKTVKGFLPVKELKPEKLNKEEEWRNWSEHFSEFVEATAPGMKECLKAVAKHEERPDADVVALSMHGHLASHSDSLYSALKHLTADGSAAKRVITSTQKEDGFTAWWSLNATFTQALAARQGAVMAQFTSTHSKPGKNPAETRVKLIEVDNAIKRWSEVMGSEVPEAMLRTAYVGILDPMTRTHLTNFQGIGTKPEELKMAILKFVSNAVVDPNAMQVGSIGEDGGAGVAHGDAGSSIVWADEDGDWEWSEDLNAISSPKGGWQYKGYQPYPKGKGKGKGKGDDKKGKGKGKGPATGCWICQGPHYASNCPLGKAKGKGKQTAYGLQEDSGDWDHWGSETESVRQLSFLRIIEPDEPATPQQVLVYSASLMGTHN